MMIWDGAVEMTSSIQQQQHAVGEFQETSRNFSAAVKIVAQYFRYLQKETSSLLKKIFETKGSVKGAHPPKAEAGVRQKIYTKMRLVFLCIKHKPNPT